MNFRAVHGLDDLFGVFILDIDKAKAFGSAALALGDDAGRDHRRMRLKSGDQLLFCDLPRKVPHVQ